MTHWLMVVVMGVVAVLLADELIRPACQWTSMCVMLKMGSALRYTFITGLVLTRLIITDA